MSLDTSDKAVSSACDDVRAGKYQWVLFSHKGQTPTIKVEESGDGFNDFIQELNGGKIMYGYMQFDVNAVKKQVFIAWCPDGIDGIAKGRFGGYCKDMERFLKGQYHLMLNARDEDDLVEADILKKLKVATGAFYTQQSNKKDLSVSQAKSNIHTAQTTNKVTRQDQGNIDKNASEQFWNEENERLENMKKQQDQKPARPVVDRSTREKFWNQQQQSQSNVGAEQRQNREAELKSKVNESKNFWNENQSIQEEKQSASQNRINSPSLQQVSTSSIKSRFENMRVEEPQQPRPTPKTTWKRPEPTPAPQEEPRPVPKTTWKRPEPTPEPEPEPQYEEQHYEEPAQHYEEPEPEPQYEEQQYQQEEQYHQEEPQYEQPYEEPAQEEEPAWEQEYEAPKAPAKLPPPPPKKAVEKHWLFKVVAMYEFTSEDSEELPFNVDDELKIIKDDGEWWVAENSEGRQGFIPCNYCSEPIPE